MTGVRGVANLITVRLLRRPSAEELKRKVGEALVCNCGQDAEPITVAVDDGTVALTGTVRVPCEKHGADLVAWLAPGINSVDNRLVVDLRGG
jgi:osmotically-inducible protein OsmY